MLDLYVLTEDIYCKHTDSRLGFQAFLMERVCGQWRVVETATSTKSSAEAVQILRNYTGYVHDVNVPASDIHPSAIDGWEHFIGKDANDDFCVCWRKRKAPIYPPDGFTADECAVLAYSLELAEEHGRESGQWAASKKAGILRARVLTWLPRAG